MLNMPCMGYTVGLALTSIALVISVCLNILLYSLRRKERQNRDVGMSMYEDSLQSDRLEEDEQQLQDNPIYGNIFVDNGEYKPRTVDGDYEPMTKQSTSTRQDEKSDSEDVSYASLDLKLFQNRKKKKRYQAKQNQTHKVQTHPPPRAQMRRMDSEADCDVALPSRSSSLIVSRSSIYLNSHQVALETEELQRERERERERMTDWELNHE